MTTKGRPSKYSPELAQTICERIADGQSLRKICADDQMLARRTIFGWLGVRPEFVHQYTRARVMSAEADADDVAYCAREVMEGRMDPAAANAAVNALKWSAGQRNPKKYGPRATYDPDAPDQINRSPINVNLLTPEQRDFLREILLASRAHNAKLLEQGQS